MEHNFNPNKGDLKYILEEKRRKEMNGTEPDDFILKKKKKFSMFFHRLKNLLFKNKLKATISKDDNKVICYILCFITS